MRASGEEDDGRSIVLDQSFPFTAAVVYTMIHADKCVRVCKSDFRDLPYLHLAALREIVPKAKVDVMM